MAFTFKFCYPDGHTENRASAQSALSKTDIPANVEKIELHHPFFDASAGEDGYYLIPDIESNAPAVIARFRERADTESVYRKMNMHVYGIKKGDKAILAVVSGMTFEYELVIGVRSNRYYMYPRFLLEDGKAYEDIKVEFFELSGADADYCGMARRYRRYQLERGACVPLRERMKKYPVLEKMYRGPEVRIRQAWKPVPPPVLEQTPENEPPVHIAVTFKRAMDIVEEFHRQGVKDAEFCLVGWNVGGHDGRFPDLFPVEPGLGTEEELVALVKLAKRYGYLICAHTNVLDSYSIAKRWSRDLVIKTKDGELLKGGRWGGGQSYFLCPKEAEEKIIPEDLKEFKRLGFSGAHYLDVMSITTPEPCYDPNHPLTRREAGEWRSRTLQSVRDAVGASASEGSWDFCCGSLDYVLYILFNMDHPIPAIADEYVPFWPIVYHGIQMYNTHSATMNAANKADKRLNLRNLEYGGRPASYFYAKFLTTGNNWMGCEDIGCATDEELQKAVANIKRNYDEYSTVSDLQLEFMEEHRNLADGVGFVRYSNGAVLIVNSSKSEFVWNGRTIPAESFARF